MSELAELLERVKAATGPDRELDWDIQQSQFGIEQTDFHGTPRYTASIDAALALAERLLPGRSWKIVGEPAAVYPHCAVIRDAGKLSDVAEAFIASHRTPALAILTALLSALNTAEGGDE